MVFDAPAALSLRANLPMLTEVKPVRVEANGRVTLTYDVGLIEGIDPREPYLPPDYVRFPTIEFSTGASWQSVAGEYAEIVDSRANATAVQADCGAAYCRQEIRG